MGNYRQHLTFATGLGVVYAAGTFVVGGVHWIYGSVAALLSAIGGLLPDLDSPTGFGLKGFTGIIGVLAAAAVWRGLSQLEPPPAFEFHLWAMVAAYVLVRHGLRRVIGKIAVHRGMCHSFPTCGICGALTYLYYPSGDHTIRVMMAGAVVLGVFSHLLLDEMFSVDLKGARVNQAFGTAMKFWAPSAWSTLLGYGVLSLVTYQVVQVWPDPPFVLHRPPPPNIPIALRLQQLKAFGHGVATSPALQERVEQLKDARPALEAVVQKAAPAVEATVQRAAPALERVVQKAAPSLESAARRTLPGRERPAESIASGAPKARAPRSELTPGRSILPRPSAPAIDSRAGRAGLGDPSAVERSGRPRIPWPSPEGAERQRSPRERP